MPLLPEGDNTYGEMDASGPKPLPQPTEEAAPTKGQTFGAAFRENNIGGALYDHFQRPEPNDAQEGFDPLVSVPKGYEPYADKFLDAQSPAQMEWTRQKIDREMADRRTIQRAGGWGFAASLAAGATDPLTLASMLIPGGGEARLGRMAYLAAVNAGTSAAQEVAMHQLQVTRSVGDSALNVGASALLGGVLGSIGRSVPKAEMNRVSEAVSREMDEAPKNPQTLGTRGNIGDQPVPSQTDLVEDLRHGPMPSDDTKVLHEPETIDAANEALTPEDRPIPESSTAGAAAVYKPTLQEESFARGAKTVAEGPIGQISPSARVMASPSLEARKLTQDLVNLPENLEKNYSGVASPSPVERELWKYEGDWNAARQDRASAFKDYRERIGDDGLSRKDFNEQVSFALRRGDQHEIPEVAKAAQATREKIFNPLYERAKVANILPEEAKLNADSYLMRQYDINAIRANPKDWHQRLVQGFMGQGVEQGEAMTIARKVTRNIQGGERGSMDWNAMQDVVPKSGRTKERTLNLPDTLLEPYLNNDIDHLTHSYLRSLAPEVELTERFGSRDLKDQFDDISDEYGRMKARALQEDNKDTWNDLDQRETADKRDLSAMRDRLYGIYGQPKDPAAFFVRAGKMLRSTNALRLLGAATLSHFPDMANVMMKFGLGKTFAAVGKVLTSPEAMKLTRSEAQRMGAALDMVSNVTASMLGDYASHSQFLEQRIMNRATRFFTIATGETPLITAVQALTSTLAQHEIIGVGQRLASGRAVSENTLARFAGGGLDSDALTRIAEQHEQFGTKVNGLNFGMSDKWADQALASKFESAVLRDAHSVTLRPGAGDTPLFMSTELGKTILQFKSFGFAASRTVVNPLLQGIAHGDPRAAQALLALTFMGTASYVAKQKAASQPIEQDPGRLALEVLDKSNLMGWTSEFAFPLLWQFGEKNLSRWSDRDPAETLLGPTAGMLASTYERHFPSRLLGDQTTPNDTMRRSDLHFLRRLAPGQNLWYLRRGINDTEDYVADAFNLPGESNEQRLASNQ